MLQFRLRSSGLTAVIVLFVWCATRTWIIGSDVCTLPYFILFFLFITYTSFVCLLSSHTNCDILSLYLYACSVCLLSFCLLCFYGVSEQFLDGTSAHNRPFQCFMGLAAWNKMDNDNDDDNYKLSWCATYNGHSDQSRRKLHKIFSYDHFGLISTDI